MAYTVKQVAAMSGVIVRTLHFYDEIDLSKPACHDAMCAFELPARCVGTHHGAGVKHGGEARVAKRVP